MDRCGSRLVEFSGGRQSTWPPWEPPMDFTVLPVMFSASGSVVCTCGSFPLLVVCFLRVHSLWSRPEEFPGESLPSNFRWSSFVRGESTVAKLSLRNWCPLSHSPSGRALPILFLSGLLPSGFRGWRIPLVATVWNHLIPPKNLYCNQFWCILNAFWEGIPPVPFSISFFCVSCCVPLSKLGHHPGQLRRAVFLVTCT